VCCGGNWTSEVGDGQTVLVCRMQSVGVNA
jgi:hypothetical protein